MNSFPRTTVGGVSLSRMIIGTNWLLGYSHTTDAKDKLVKDSMTRDKIADIIEVFLDAGVDTIMGLAQRPLLQEAIQEAQQRTGKKLIVVSTPGIPTTAETPAKGFSGGDAGKVLDKDAEVGATFCFPHQGTTDNLVDRCTHRIRHMDQLCRMIRERGMIPGLSTHMPESIIYADESGLDVATYISLYNAMGFLMQVEVDWIAQIIHGAQKPVMTIKPMAAGHIRPFQALSFVWTTLRECDMVTVGTMSPDEAKECVDISLAILERRYAKIKLQETRSKASVKPVELVRGSAGEDAAPAPAGSKKGNGKRGNGRK
jgi:hypothetical protein